MKKMLRSILIMMLSGIVFSSCSKIKTGNSNTSNSNVIPTHTLDNSGKNNGSTNTVQATNNTISSNPLTTELVKDDIESILGKMSLEEKVGQLFIISLRNLKSGSNIQEMNDEVKGIISQYKVGGIILFSDNIKTIPQTSKLINDMQKVVKIPLFMSVDEEGGKISRLNSSQLMHATKIPTNLEIGNTNDTLLAKKVGGILAKEISSLGFNMDFAPVADVNTNPNNPIIGDRAFGSDAAKVAEMVSSEVQGIQNENVSAVIKHFPGHGDTSTDTHKGTVVINHDINRLRSVEFKPFVSGINAGVDAVMVAHITVPNVSGADIPSTMSPMVITNILRNELGFNGIVITDALDMDAITKTMTPGKASLKAFSAGVDILLMPSSLNEAYNEILNAVKRGEISQKRLDESVRRILKTKSKRGILNMNTHLDPEIVLGNAEHINIVNEINKINKK